MRQAGGAAARLLPLAGLLGSLGSAHAASFDCARAGTTHERHVCADPVLSAADTVMGTAYRAAVKTFPVKGFVQATQRRFLLEYAQCEAGRSCLETVSDRVAVLQSMQTDFVYTDGRPDRGFDPDNGVFWLVVQGGAAVLHYYGGFMPDMNVPEPFPQGFVCDDTLAMTRAAFGWSGEDRASTATVSESKVTAHMSCSARNGLIGDFKRVR